MERRKSIYLKCLYFPFILRDTSNTCTLSSFKLVPVEMVPLFDKHEELCPTCFSLLQPWSWPFLGCKVLIISSYLKYNRWVHFVFKPCYLSVCQHYLHSFNGRFKFQNSRMPIFCCCLNLLSWTPHSLQNFLHFGHLAICLHLCLC